MFATKSIRTNFLIQLIFSSVTLIIIFSSLLYFYIEKSIYDEKKEELVEYAKNISANKSVFQTDEAMADNFFSLNVGIIYLNNLVSHIHVYENTQNNHTYLTLIYPFNLDDKSYLKITKDITQTKKLLEKIRKYIFIINIASILLVIVYAVTLSKMLIAPIQTLAKRLANMNEHLIAEIDAKKLPQEFEPLGVTLNHLILRIENFVKYQKELFIGTAHELKTPLAVIKLKNQVTLIKKRSTKEYIEAIQTTNKAVDEMNIIVSNILNIGRQEGAQLDRPIEVDVIAFLQKKADDFKLLAEHEGKKLHIDFKPDSFITTLQVSVLNQIIQNFLQNAIKFTPKNKSIILRSAQNGDKLLIEVIDEGCGIDEGVDLFAPFKRQGNKSGVGLGLFLAKSAADALGAKITIKNRRDGVDGTVASLELNSQLSCIIPQPN